MGIILGLDTEVRRQHYFYAGVKIKFYDFNESPNLHSASCSGLCIYKHRRGFWVHIFVISISHEAMKQG